MPDVSRLDLPQLAALRAFEMAGRLNSFTLAGDALLISQSAVSRQVASLEELLGCRLFVRDRSGVRLTDHGHSYHQRISRGLREISAATTDLKLQLAGLNLVRLSTLPTLATQWLLPILAEFRAENPQIAIDIASSNELADLERGEADVAIRLGRGAWPGLHVEKLFEECITTVCSPLVAAKMAAKSMADVNALDLIHTTTRPDAWQCWVDGNNLCQSISVDNKISCQDFFISIQAAVLGHGFAVVPSFLVQKELAEGRLVDPLQMPVKGEQAYYFVSTPEVAQRRAIKELREWLTQQTRLL